MGVYQRKDVKNGAWYMKFVLHGKTYKKNIPGVTCREDAEEAEEDWRNGLALFTTWETKGTCRANRGSVGGAAELLTCADLLRRGYDVFRSVTNSAACDLIVMRDGIICRVEVKTARTLKNGAGAFLMRPKQIGQHDVVAAVMLDTSRIDYRPNIEVWFKKKAAA